MTAILPHDELETPPTVRLDELYIDGVERPERVEEHLQRIDLTGASSEWRALQMSATVSAEDGEIAALLDDGLEPRAVLVVSCPATNLRLGFAFANGPGDGDWATTIHLALDDLREKVSIYAEIVADIDGRPARRIGTSDPWQLYVDETAVPPFEGTFQVKWSHFGREAGVPDGASTESFFIDLGETVPLIHLNQDMDGLYELLSAGVDRPPMEVALREAEMRRIATAAWVSAIGASAAAIRVDPETGEHELPERQWMADVLRWSLPSIYPASTTDEALHKIRHELLGPQAAVVQAMVQLTVSRHMHAGKLLGAALKSAGTPE